MCNIFLMFSSENLFHLKMTILILGQSDHLIGLIKKVESSDNIQVVPWRKINDIQVNFKPNKIYVVGYNYKSYSMKFELYLAKNVENIVNFIKK